MEYSKGKLPDIELNLKEIAFGLLSHIWVIIFCGLLVGTIFFAGSYALLDPQYLSSVTLYTTNMTNTYDSENVSYADLTASAMIANTGAEILKSELVLNEVIDKLDYEFSRETLLEMVDISVPKNTEMITVNIRSDNPLYATYVADAYAEVASEELMSIIEGSTVKVLNHAVIPTKPAGPSYLKLLIFGMALGSAAAVMVLLVRLIFDVRIKSVKDIEHYGYPVLGVIPDIPTAGKHGGYYRK